MKKFLLLTLLALGTFQIANAQNADPAINVDVIPGSVQQNSTAVITVTAANTGTTNIVSNSLEVTVVAGSNAEITGLSTGSDNTWTVTSSTTGTNNTYILSNTGGGVDALDGGEILLNVTGTVVSSSSTMSASIAYLSGTNADLSGALNTSQGNGQQTNDESSTTFNVITATPLPVNLIAFSGSAKFCTAMLTWQVTAEEMMNRYEVQTSVDGSSFVTQKTVSAGIAKGEGTYTAAVDQSTTKTYYRLKMVGINSEVGWSKTISVITNCAIKEVAVFPNPTTGIVTVTGIQAGTVVTVHNTLGQQVASSVSAAPSTVLQLQDLSAGQYLITFAGAENTHPVMITKTR